MNKFPKIAKFQIVGYGFRTGSITLEVKPSIGTRAKNVLKTFLNSENSFLVFWCPKKFNIRAQNVGILVVAAIQSLMKTVEYLEMSKFLKISKF